MVSLTVMGDGKKRTYLIQVATDLVKKAEDERKAKLATQDNVSTQPSSPPQQEVEVIEEKVGGEKKEEPQSSPSTNSKQDEIFEAFGNRAGTVLVTL